MYLIEFVVIFFALVLCALSAIDNYKNWQDKKYKKLLNVIVLNELVKCIKL